MNEPFVRVLGSADWHQTAHNDHSCYTVSDRILIDACPSVVTQLQEAGVDPLDVHLVLVTHMHCDHYMGLAPLMHYWRVCRQTDLSGLTIAGPRETVQDYVDFTLRFVFRDKLDACVTRMPRILPLGEGDTLHHEGYAVHVHEADHAVPARSYRLVHEESGRSVGFTGDTRYQQSLPGFFRNVDLLLHEVSLGAGPVDPVHNADCRHSSAQEAVRVCRESGARRLLLTHCYEGKRQTALDEARRLLDRSVDWAMPGSVFPF
ncbi:MAG: MBL fold metallo-hydrolase [Candidatus Ventricola sp.]